MEVAWMEEISTIETQVVQALKPVLLLVEDDQDIREQLKWAMSRDYTVLEAKDRRAAMTVVRRDCPWLVLLDLGLPPAEDDVTEGMATLREILQFDPAIKVIISTGKSDQRIALNAIQSGAYDFVEKPVELDVLKVILQRAAYLHRLEHENRVLMAQAGAGAVGQLLGLSSPMQGLFKLIRRVASSSVPVLITGESGTGKELVAKAIHRESPRLNGPFVAINCGAIPEQLLESELFGHEKGSFTGAHQQQKGKIEYANGGTLLLDEIGEMPLALQVKLLRFLQESQIDRVGGREPVEVDTRIVAATNINLQEAIESGKFRKDLYYRLSVVQIPVPSLRERGEDIILLAQAFLLRYRAALNVRVSGLSEDAREAIRTYSWPGNVRELENRIKRGVIMAAGATLTPGDLELTWNAPERRPLTFKEAKLQMERDFLLRSLVTHNWNITRAAEELGISRQTLHDFIKKYGLDKPEWGPVIMPSEEAAET
jgi:two-component system NtrC family response regulator